MEICVCTKWLPGVSIFTGAAVCFAGFKLWRWMRALRAAGWASGRSGPEAATVGGTSVRALRAAGGASGRSGPEAATVGGTVMRALRALRAAGGASGGSGPEATATVGGTVDSDASSSLLAWGGSSFDLPKTPTHDLERNRKSSDCEEILRIRNQGT